MRPYGRGAAQSAFVAKGHWGDAQLYIDTNLAPFFLVNLDACGQSHIKANELMPEGGKGRQS